MEKKVRKHKLSITSSPIDTKKDNMGYLQQFYVNKFDTTDKNVIF